MRGPDESYSDAILRLARADARQSLAVRPLGGAITPTRKIGIALAALACAPTLLPAIEARTPKRPRQPTCADDADPRVCYCAARS
jgi:hypothetical protein